MKPTEDGVMAEVTRRCSSGVDLMMNENMRKVKKKIRIEGQGK